jgi:hypothetical protein
MPARYRTAPTKTGKTKQAAPSPARCPSRQPASPLLPRSLASRATSAASCYCGCCSPRHGRITMTDRRFLTSASPPPRPRARCASCLSAVRHGSPLLGGRLFASHARQEEILTTPSALCLHHVHEPFTNGVLPPCLPAASRLVPAKSALPSSLCLGSHNPCLSRLTTCPSGAPLPLAVSNPEQSTAAFLTVVSVLCPGLYSLHCHPVPTILQSPLHTAPSKALLHPGSILLLTPAHTLGRSRAPTEAYPDARVPGGGRPRRMSWRVQVARGSSKCLGEFWIVILRMSSALSFLLILRHHHSCLALMALPGHHPSPWRTGHRAP